MIATFEFDQNLVGKTLNINFLDVSEPNGDYEYSSTNFDTGTVVVNQENQAEIDFTNKENFSHIQFLLYEEVEEDGETFEEITRTSKYIPIASLNEEFNSVDFTDESIEFNDENSAILFRYSELTGYGGQVDGIIVPEMNLAGIIFDEDDIDFSGIEIELQVVERIYDENDPNGETYTETVLETKTVTTVNYEYGTGAQFFSDFTNNYVGSYNCNIKVLNPGVILRDQNVYIGDYWS